MIKQIITHIETLKKEFDHERVKVIEQMTKHIEASMEAERWRKNPWHEYKEQEQRDFMHPIPWSAFSGGRRG